MSQQPRPFLYTPGACTPGLLGVQDLGPQILDKKAGTRHIVVKALRRARPSASASAVSRRLSPLPCARAERVARTRQVMESACTGACADAQPAAPHTLGASAKLGVDTEAHDPTCAICLETIALADLSVIKGCEHAYCGVALSLRSQPDLLTLCAVRQLPAANVAGVCADCDI